jgi:2-polyprenyl-3-methyl-5-hydroxy-6-metoxy-1,4-benzoquinol methylase
MKNFARANSLFVEIEELKSCPNCQSHDLRFWRRGYDQLHELSQQEFIYSQCQNCNLIFLSLRPLEQEIHHFYPEDYKPYQPNQFQKNSSQQNLSSSNLLPTKSWFKTTSQKILTKIYKLYKIIMPTSIFSESFKEQFQKFYEPREAESTLLDFGCGSEQFLNNAQEKGWNTTIGIDFSDQVVAGIRDRGHQALLMSPTVWDEIENESLDFVRMNHVLEHLYDPEKNLQAIYAKMKPGAKLHIGVPHPYGISSRIFRSNWWGLECPRHIMLYPPKLLEKKLISTKYFQIKTFHRSIAKDLLRSCGYVLYNLGLIRHDQVEKMAQKRYLITLLHPVTKLASVFGIGDRFDIFCLKEQ